MGNESVSGAGSNGMSSQSNASAVAQTANIGRSTSVTSGAAKVFREFKWGLLTLFLLMVVVIGLVYDGGRKKKPLESEAGPKTDERLAQIGLDSGPEAGLPPGTINPPAPMPVPVAPNINEVAGPPGIPPVEPRSALGEPQLKPAPIPTPAPKPEVAGGEKTYVVKAGDTLSTIAASQWSGKGGLKAILDANKDVLPNPNKLRVGMTLKIPAAAPAVTSAPTRTDAPKPDAPKNDAGAKKNEALTKEVTKESHADSEYIVQSGDTLERIARKVFSDGRKWRDIYEWNREALPEPGRLQVGQVLKMKQASPAAAVPSPKSSTSRAEVVDEPVQSQPVPASSRAKAPTAVKEEEPAAPSITVTSGAIFP